MLVFGDETRNYFLVIGQAVDDVRLAQNMAQVNDVILSPNCWQLCDRSMIEIERIPDQRAVKVGVMLLLVQSSASPCQGPPVRKATGSMKLATWMGSVWDRLESISPGHLLWEEPSLVSSRGSDQAFLW